MGRSLARSAQMQHLVRTLLLAITWAPLFCALAPMLVLSLAVRLALYQVGTQWFQIKQPDCESDWSEQCSKDVQFMVFIGFVITVWIISWLKLWSIVLLCCVPGVWWIMSLHHSKQKSASSLETDPDESTIDVTAALFD